MGFESSVGSSINDIPGTISTLFPCQTAESDKLNDYHFREKAFALNYVSNAVIQYDRDMNIIWANKSACILSEMSSKELVGNNRCQNLLNCCSSECSRCPVKNVFRKEQQYSAKIQTEDGRVLSITAVPFIDLNGDIDSVIEIIEDKTYHVAVQRLLSDDYSDVIAFSQKLASLTRREHQVMKLVVNGKSNKSISSELCISPKTVEIHRSRMMKKLNVNSLAELVRRSTLFEFYDQRISHQQLRYFMNHS